eukprot:3403937-Lingulodinium_polyedra.AAC.1
MQRGVGTAPCAKGGALAVARAPCGVLPDGEGRVAEADHPGRARGQLCAEPFPARLGHVHEC